MQSLEEALNKAVTERDECEASKNEYKQQLDKAQADNKVSILFSCQFGLVCEVWDELHVWITWCNFIGLHENLS